MSIRDFLLALSVILVWGTNFVVIRLGLNQFPPLLFAALRFTFALVPAVLVVPRPRASWGNLATYGLLIGFGQFGLLFLAMKGQISPGLASLVIQMQVFFTIALSAVLMGERVRAYQVLALLIGAAGIAVIAAHTDATTTPLGLVLVLIAAAAWSGGNVASKRSGTSDMLGYVVWASLFSAPPLFLLSFGLEGWPAVVGSVRTAGLFAWAAVVWQSVGNTMFGYGLWAWLLNRYPAATVTPMALLIPVVGMASSAWYLGEPFPLWKLTAACLVMVGLAVNLAVPRWTARHSRVTRRAGADPAGTLDPLP